VDEQSDRTVRAVTEALSRCRASLSNAQRRRIADAIDEVSKRHGYEPLFVQAIIEVESQCQPSARSPRGAVGLIQIQPETARALAEEAGLRWRGTLTLLDPATNIRLGILYLSKLEERFGNLHLAVAAYNMGPSRVGSMPSERARKSRYVRKVLARYRDLLADRSLALS
jgi:soluble lytic murein transglycosylase